jgi:hypothetical protein
MKNILMPCEVLFVKNLHLWFRTTPEVRLRKMSHKLTAQVLRVPVRVHGISNLKLFFADILTITKTCIRIVEYIVLLLLPYRARTGTCAKR